MMADWFQGKSTAFSRCKYALTSSYQDHTSTLSTMKNLDIQFTRSLFFL